MFNVNVRAVLNEREYADKNEYSASSSPNVHKMQSDWKYERLVLLSLTMHVNEMNSAKLFVPC